MYGDGPSKNRNQLYTGAAWQDALSNGNGGAQVTLYDSSGSEITAGNPMVVLPDRSTVTLTGTTQIRDTAFHAYNLTGAQQGEARILVVEIITTVAYDQDLDVRINYGNDGSGGRIIYNGDSLADIPQATDQIATFGPFDEPPVGAGVVTSVSIPMFEFMPPSIGLRINIRTTGGTTAPTAGTHAVYVHLLG